ncbi:MAG: ABC transporter permease subunit, partial [Roseimicrobium sp.]
SQALPVFAMSDLPQPQPSKRPVPERFLASKGTLRLDRFMSYTIQFGGVGIIIAVFGIFFFILLEILPLFGRASVHEDRSFPVGLTGPGLLGADEWAQKPFFYDGRSVRFADLTADGKIDSQPAPLPENVEATAWKLDAKLNRIFVGTADGRVGSVKINYTAGETSGQRTVTASVNVEPFAAIGVPGKRITGVSSGDGGAAKVLAAIQDVDGTAQVHVQCVRVKRGLLGSGKPEVVGRFDLTPELEGRAVQVLASSVGDSVLVVTDKGIVHYFYFTNGTSKELRQKFQPFSRLPNPAFASIGYVFGDVSVIVTSMDGLQEAWSLYNQTVQKDGAASQLRLYGKIKELPELERPAAIYSNSLRNKVYLSVHQDFASLRHATSGVVRWQDTLPFTAAHAILDGKAEHLLFLDNQGTIHRFTYHDPHPEAGWNAFFGKIWYEGADGPSYTWQSTSGTDDFEPKLSLVPLIIGSLKGTLYALLFAVPIALLAALYTSCFLPSEVKTYVKPIMEIMASLPSVVLGFLAGLWLAPLIEDKVPSILLAFVALPLGVLLFGWLYTKLPVKLRAKVPTGMEYLVLVVPIILICVASWLLGPWLESWLFVVREPGTGKEIADFRLWWPQFSGASFDQRNSLVVGFMMGFAVIPIVFTITEDALSNVPPQLRAASLALGATRWQMVRTVVLPVASAGIFSALMIGFGRAVGETMIVVMATGNTPVLDFNIFSGMRTLSANTAVELPEAAVHSTHYRTLFLSAMALFLLTFALNTVAELLRYRLRERFKIV